MSDCTCGAGGGIDGHARTCALFGPFYDESTVPTPAENGEYGRQVAEESPEAAGLLVQVMDANARAADREAERQREYDARVLEGWRDRALRAEAELRAVRSGFERILYPNPGTIDTYVIEDDAHGIGWGKFPGEH